MNQAELIDAIAAETELTKADVKRVLDAQAEVVFGALGKAKADEVAVPGLGKFKVNKRKARKGRNPQTGEEIKIPAKKVPTFTASKALKDVVARK